MDKLNGKVAVVYGNGAIGGTIAEAFAREGAKVFLAGRTMEKLLPIVTYTRSHFITARAAAKRMIAQGNGVILMHTANISQVPSPGAGGRPAGWAALEALCRSLSVECGGSDVRAICLFTTAIPETPAIRTGRS